MSNKTQNYILKLKLSTLFLSLFLLTNHHSLIPNHHSLIPTAWAQEVSLSITPPLLEVTIQPGRQVTQVYKFSNNTDYDISSSIKIVPFTAKDEFGNINPKETSSSYPLNFEIKPAGPFFVRGGTSQEIVLKIDVPEKTAEQDYYFVLLFTAEPENLGLGSNSQAKAKIGTNILLSVSKDGNPPKKALIKQFTAPKIIDSLFKIHYQVRIENTGPSFFKPTGEIVIKDLFGKETSLNLAPQNILAHSTRKIFCLNGEKLISCAVDKSVLFGPLKATLSFKAGDSGPTYSAKTTTFAFPFSIILAGAIIFIIFKAIRQPRGEQTST